MRQESHSIQVDGEVLTLDDLRWLVGQCTDYSPQSKVDVRREGEHRTISIEGKAVPKPLGTTSTTTPTPTWWFNHPPGAR